MGIKATTWCLLVVVLAFSLALIPSLTTLKSTQLLMVRSILAEKREISFKRVMQKQLWKQGADLDNLYPILCSLELSCRDINRLMRRISSDNLSGLAGGNINVQGEEQKMLDVVANNMMKNALCASGQVRIVASEEDAEPCLCSSVVASTSICSKYAVVFDPLDGSSNTDSGLPTGTIFGVYKNPGFGQSDHDVLKRKGSNLVVAGYCLYAASTHLVITLRMGVYQFTMDDQTGEFFLTKSNIRIPQNGPIYSYNDANSDGWSNGVQMYFRDFKNSCVSIDLTKLERDFDTCGTNSDEMYKSFGGDDREESVTRKKPTARYMGALVADAHNVLYNGGFYAYPGSIAKPEGKIRLLYEANPMALIFEEAGGLASNGYQRILDLNVAEIHARTPIFLGSFDDISALQWYNSFYK